MAGEVPEESRVGVIDLPMVWQLLTEEEQREFWKFAGQYARDLNHRTTTFRQLCVAFRDAAAGNSRDRQTKPLPGAARPLSSDDLQRGIARLKNRLLEQPNAQPFLIGAFCSWIQDSRRAELNAVLDVVKCPHDGRGTLKGSIPNFAPEDAAHDISALASMHNPRDLAMVCGGLILNNANWRGLWEAFDALPKNALSGSRADLVQSQPSQEPQVDNVAAPVGLTAESIDADALRAIREGLELLRQQLAEAIADIAAAKVPNLDVAIDCWRLVQRQYSDAEAALGVSSPSIADLEAALAHRSEAALALTEFARCRSIVHVTDPNFGGHAVIRAKCDELEKSLKDHPLEPVALRAVAALLQLIAHGEELDDDHAAQLQADVETLFGKAVAAAALRGKLSFTTELVSSGVEGGETKTTAQTLPVEALDQKTDAPGKSESVDSAAQVELEPVKAQAEIADLIDQEANALADEGAKEISAPGTASYEPAPGAPSDKPVMDAGGQATTGAETRQDAAKVPATTLPGVNALTAMELAPPDPEFESFENFCGTHWVDESGSVALAPWRANGFVAALAQQAIQAWELGEVAVAYVFSRAVSATSGAEPFGIDDLASADRLLSDPATHSSGMDAVRAERLRSHLAGPIASGQYTFGLALMLEALRPAHPSSFTPPEIETLLERASYNDPALNDVVRYLLLGWSSDLNPLNLMRSRLLDAPDEPVEVIEAKLLSAQAALRTVVATLWSAAGGKIQQTHCRSAWANFIREEVVPLRDELAPSDVKASARIRWTPDRIRERVIAFGRSFRRIMDSAEVKHRDRTAAEGAAQQIVEVIDQLADALQRLNTQRQRSHASYDGIPYEAAQRLLSGSSSSTAESLCATLFAAALHNKPQPNKLRLKAGYLINHVDVIRYLNSQALSRPGVGRDGVRVLDFDNPASVSALLVRWRAQDPPLVDDDSELRLALRNAAADKERRDILAALSATDVLQPHERTLLHRYALELGDRTFEATRELERLWGACNELMTSTESRLKSVVEEAKSLTTNGVVNSSMTKSLLLLAWQRQNVALATAHRDLAAQALLDLAKDKPDDIAARIASYFEAGDYRAGVALFHGGSIPRASADRLAGRRTVWREDALRMWPEPRTKLAIDLRGSTPEQIRLVEAWTAGTIEASQRDSMPRLLYAVISGEAGRSSSENQKRFPVKLADLREHRERKTVISCEAVRTYFQRSRLNPTFLPQLATFSQIVIAPSPYQSTRRGSVLDDWCKAADNEEPSSLVVFLAPALPLARRDELCSGLRKRGVTAAIVDDVDLCRLCATSARSDGHDFIPFLEVLLEQLDLDRASPFSSLDGQHVRLETYIGRTQEAQNVALGWSYTRVFSGRKLGKSALLKYVANTFDGYQLPSGNELSVFFITIAGGESERWVVDCIVDEMTARFGLQEKPALKSQPPAERFSEYMKRFLQEKPRHSVLLILDEADAFVEGQLARYDIDRENSLSFRMMKELPAQVDANQLPRIRTIFSGYRVTNTRGGVWANAGDVLVLRPLAEEEAVHFLQGMLARVGIALGNHAPFVAMRCGFQPAVLIRFGENLIKRLKRSNKSANRETLAVSHDEVLATLGEQGVLDEIRTVVNNNFQGNRIGAIVFGATLLALKDLEPGLALTQGPEQVLAKLVEIDPNSDWLERIDTAPLSEIERNLQDFIDRELLTVSDAPRFGVREYRLRFPHFLPVLTQQSEIALEVRQQIQAIRGGASQRRVSQCVLSESSLDTVRYWFRENNVKDCKLIVVGGHWTSALLDAKCGVPDRLGCERAAVSLATRPEEVSRQIAIGIQVFGHVAAGVWTTFLSADSSRPLVLIGSLDLQRTARRYALDGGEVPVEVVTLGRLTEATLAWWFEDARALHFKTGDSIAKIAQATGLVPFLVEAFSSLLPQTPSSEVSEQELEMALSRLDAEMANYAAKLSDTLWEGGLSLREIELLKMAVQIAEEVADDFDLERDFQECWSLLESPSASGAPFSDSGDWSALKLLTEAGLLPARSDVGSAPNSQSLGRVRFEPSSALVRLIKLLG